MAEDFECNYLTCTVEGREEFEDMQTCVGRPWRERGGGNSL